MRRALVTGGRGFVGAWLCRELLERGVEVRSLDRRGPHERPSTLRLLGVDGDVEEVEGDLRDRAAVTAALAGEDTVFHLAAETIVGTVKADPVGGFETNVAGTWTLLEACRKEGTERVVVASSDKAYGAHEELPYPRDLPRSRPPPTRRRRRRADLIARSYWPLASRWRSPASPTSTAAAISTSRRLILEAACAVLDGRRLVLRSDGSPVRDLLYVEDAVGAYLAIAAALDRDDVRGEAFNAGGERPYSVLEIVSAITDVAGSDVEPDVRGSGNPDGEIDRQYVDASKIDERCGWRPRVALEEGIARTLAWYRERPEIRPA